MVKVAHQLKHLPCQDNALHWNAMFFFIILIDKIEYPLTYLYITELCHYAKKLYLSTGKCISTKNIEGNTVLSKDTIYQKKYKT